MLCGKPMSEYKSKLEAEVAKQLGDAWGYESCNLQYHIPKSYKPDFVNDDQTVFLEVKGWFRPGDTLKYKSVAAKCKKRGIVFIMVLQTPNKRVRKGSDTTMSQWCDKNKIRWVSAHSVYKIRQEYEDAGSNLFRD